LIGLDEKPFKRFPIELSIKFHRAKATVLMRPGKPTTEAKNKVPGTKTNMDHNSSDWSECETTKHQDHVIAHVLGATVLGWLIAGEAAHLLLDIGFLWTIYLDGEMNLLPQGVAIPELEADELTSADKTELAFDAQLLLSEGRDASGLKRFTASPIECLINTVEFFAASSERRIVVSGDEGNISVETSLEDAGIVIRSS